MDVLKKRLRVVNFRGAGAAVVLLSATAALGIYPRWVMGKNNIRDAADLVKKQVDLDTLDAVLQESKKDFKQTQARLAARRNGIAFARGRHQFLPQSAHHPQPRRRRDHQQHRHLQGLCCLARLHAPATSTSACSGDWKSCMKLLKADIHKMKGLGVPLFDTLVLDASIATARPSHMNHPAAAFIFPFPLSSKRWGNEAWATLTA